MGENSDFFSRIFAWNLVEGCIWGGNEQGEKDFLIKESWDTFHVKKFYGLLRPRWLYTKYIGNFHK